LNSWNAQNPNAANIIRPTKTETIAYVWVELVVVDVCPLLDNELAVVCIVGLVLGATLGAKLVAVIGIIVGVGLGLKLGLIEVTKIVGLKDGSPIIEVGKLADVAIVGLIEGLIEIILNIDIVGTRVGTKLV